MKKLLAFLLACLTTVGTVVLGCCDGQGVYNSVVSDLNSSNTESNASLEGDASNDESVDSSQGKTSSDNAQSSMEDSSSSDENPADEEALAALQAAIEKSLQQEKNYTYQQTVDMESKIWLDDKLEQNVTVHWEQTEKREGRKGEERRDETSYDYIYEEAETRFWHYIYEFTNEEETEAVGYDYEDGQWQKTNMSFSGDEKTISAAVKIYQQIAQSLQYDKETGIYYIEDLTVDLTDIMGDLEGLENGYATGIYHRLEIELKDGYIYRLYADMEQYLKTTKIYDGEEHVFESHKEGKQSEYFSNWGTTVVTLPEIEE